MICRVSSMWPRGLSPKGRRAALDVRRSGVSMEFRVFGPVEAYVDGRLVDLGRPQQRLVLAVLLVNAGRLVSTELLIERVWDGAPDGARRTAHVHITRLRRLLAQIGATTRVPVTLVH